LTGNQFKVLTVFVRCILEYHKTVDAISSSYVAGMTGIDRANSKKIIKQLIQLGCVKIVSQGDRKNPTVYTLINITEKLTGIKPNNTSLSPTVEDTIWRITSQKTEGVVTTTQGVVENDPTCGNHNTGGVVTTTQGVVENDPTCGNYNTGGVVKTGHTK
jgi:hypothetical protein